MIYLCSTLYNATTYYNVLQCVNSPELEQISVGACLAWRGLFVNNMFKQVLKRLSLLRHQGTPMTTQTAWAKTLVSMKHRRAPKEKCP